MDRKSMIGGIKYLERRSKLPSIALRVGVNLAQCTMRANVPGMRQDFPSCRQIRSSMLLYVGRKDW